MSKELLKPSTDNTESVKKHFNHEKEKQKFYYHHKRGVKDLPLLDSGKNIFMSPFTSTKTWVPGSVVEQYGLRRSYIVKHGDCVYRRNRNTQVNRMSKSRRVLATGGKQRSFGLHMVCFEMVLYHNEPH